MAPSIITMERLQPSTECKSSHPKSVPLSILDNTCGRFSPTGAIWVFDSKPSADNLMVERLRDSLTSALALFPHFAGQLHWAPCTPGGGHTSRFGRAMVTYGSLADPGVECSVVKITRTASDLVPTAAKRCSGSQIWVNKGFPQVDLLQSTTKLALADGVTGDGLPAMIVQISLLDDGGFTVAVKMSHLLADAASLTMFVKRWAAMCRRKGDILPQPVFDPRLLDVQAAGDIDGLKADVDIVAKARALPIHQFDWWNTSADAFPPFLVPATKSFMPTNPVLLDKAKLEHAATPPWQTWDLLKPVTHAVIHFKASQIKSLQDSAENNGPRVSRLDALLAHVWSAINRARDLRDSNESVYMNVTLGVRARLNPPLPDTFVGSPLLIAHVVATGREAAETSSVLARKLRACLHQFTSQAVGAHLHHSAHAVSPSRLWQAFLGRHHVLVTAWLRLGVDEVDFFGDGQKPRYVHPVMPPMDGCLQVMEAADGKGGMDVSLYLEAEAMGKLLQDSILLNVDPGQVC